MLKEPVFLFKMMRIKMLLVNFSKSADNFIEKLPAKQFKQIITKVLDLRNNPRPHDSIKLTGYEKFRTDIGEYRIIYTFDTSIVNIELIGKRNDDEIYKKLKSR